MEENNTAIRELAGQVASLVKTVQRERQTGDNNQTNLPDSKSFWLCLGIHLASLGLFWHMRSSSIRCVGDLWLNYDLP